MNLLDLLILSCGTWYLSECLVSKDGPFEVFERLRSLPHGGLLDCIYCTALWVALFLYILWFISHPETDGFMALLHILGITGIALMLRSYTGVQHG